MVGPHSIEFVGYVAVIGADTVRRSAAVKGRIERLANQRLSTVLESPGRPAFTAITDSVDAALDAISRHFGDGQLGDEAGRPTGS